MSAYRERRINKGTRCGKHTEHAYSSIPITPDQVNWVNELRLVHLIESFWQPGAYISATETQRDRAKWCGANELLRTQWNILWTWIMLNVRIWRITFQTSHTLSTQTTLQHESLLFKCYPNTYIISYLNSNFKLIFFGLTLHHFCCTTEIPGPNWNNIVSPLANYSDRGRNSELSWCIRVICKRPLTIWFWLGFHAISVVEQMMQCGVNEILRFEVTIQHNMTTG